MAFILPDVSSVICVQKFCFRYSYSLLLIPFLIAFHYFIIRRNIVRLLDKAEQKEYEQQKKHQRTIFFILRSLLIALLLIAIASPFILSSTTIKGNPRITILVDNSTSMGIFDQSVASEVENTLKSQIPVTVRTISSSERSEIGNGILQNLERDENVLVISDGQTTSGTLLGDIALLASSLNVTVSTISLKAQQSDVGVSILGPAEAIRDTEEYFIIEVSNTGDEIPYTLEVRFDNELVLAVSDKKSATYSFKKKLTEGYHKISAELINVKDHFSQNNRFYKTVKVVPRPKVLFVSERQSLLADSLGSIYDLTFSASIPADINQYLAIVTNDLPAAKLAPHIEGLSSYVSDGSGLFVIGGEHSYDRGGYKGTLIETLLPAKVGAGEASEKSDVHIVLVIDVSGTTGTVYNGNTGQWEVRGFDNVIKAQAVSVIGSLDDDKNIGVIVTGLRDVSTIHTLSPLVTLGDNKKNIIDLISRISSEKVGGQTIDLKFGIDRANQMLREVSGGKNIIVISDGRGLAPRPQEEVLEAARAARVKGIKTYVAGVGASTDQSTDFLTSLAQQGGGVYFPIDASQRLEILFGEPDEKDDLETLNKLVLLDTTHFITYNQSLDVIVSGYNYLIPKPSSRLLVTTTKNIPILAAWRFGLGRVVSLGTDDGSKWSGQMLSKSNSKVLTKSLNWAIGDLSRQRSFDVKAYDVHVGETLYVTVISDSVPTHDKLQFVKTDVNTYVATFEASEPGFYNFLGADVAINYPKEYLHLGTSAQFLNMVSGTQGKIFEQEQTKEMLEFIKEKSKRIKVDSMDLKWPLIIAIILLLLLDIGIRRIWENQSVKT